MTGCPRGTLLLIRHRQNAPSLVWIPNRREPALFALSAGNSLADGLAADLRTAWQIGSLRCAPRKKPRWLRFARRRPAAHRSVFRARRSPAARLFPNLNPTEPRVRRSTSSTATSDLMRHGFPLEDRSWAWQSRQELPAVDARHRAAPAMVLPALQDYSEPTINFRTGTKAILAFRAAFGLAGQRPMA